MIYFFSVAAPARSGTMWFSRLLTTNHTYCFHELSTVLRPYPTNVAAHDWLAAQVADHDFERAQRRTILQAYPEFFLRLWERATMGQHIVGNSDHFLLDLLPGLFMLWPDMRFIFSARNGINCVQSAYTHFAHVPPDVLHRRTRRWQTDDYFEQCCHDWVEQINALERSKAWLWARAQCIETRLERITSDLGEVKVVWDWLGIGQWEEHAQRNAQLIATPVNARTNRDQVVNHMTIWNNWPDDRRQAFERICGETQQRLGYAATAD